MSYSLKFQIRPDLELKQTQRMNESQFKIKPENRNKQIE